MLLASYCHLSPDCAQRSPPPPLRLPHPSSFSFCITSSGKPSLISSNPPLQPLMPHAPLLCSDGTFVGVILDCGFPLSSEREPCGDQCLGWLVCASVFPGSAHKSCSRNSFGRIPQHGLQVHCALGVRDRICARRFPGVRAGGCRGNEVAAVTGLESPETKLPILLGVRTPEGPCFWGVWEEIPGGHEGEILQTLADLLIQSI